MKNTIILSALNLIFFMALGFTFPVQSLYAEALGASYTVIGLMGAIFSLAQILFGYVWGSLSDHLGQRKSLLIAGLAVSVVGQGLMAIVPSYEYLLPLIALVSASQAGYLTLGLAMVGDLLEQRAEGRGRWMGFYRGMGSLGFGLTAFVAGSVAERFSLRAPFGIHALIVLVSLLITLAIDEPTPQTEAAPRDEAGAWRILVVSVRDAVKAIGNQFAALFRANGAQSSESDRAPGRLPLTPLLVSAFLWFLAYGAVSGVWSNYLANELGYTSEYVGRLYSIAALTEVPFMVLVGWLSDRTGRLPMLSLGFLIWTLVFAGYVLTPMPPWIVVIQFVRGFAYSAFTATTMTYAAEARSKSERGQASGLYNASSGLGSTLGAPLGGAQAQYTGSRAMIVTNAALMLAGGVYVAVVAVRQRMFARRRAL
jgi:MFS family permease